MGSQTVHALRGVDLRVKSGEMIAVMGHSGSGKSTLMNMLGCLDVPTSGDYYLDGVKVNGLSKNQLADLRNQKLGIRVPGLQPARAHQRARERGAAAALRPLRQARDTRARAALAGARGPRPARRSSSERVVGRPAAARRHCARARHDADRAARRRADR